MAEIIFPEGLFIEKPSEGSPELLRANLSFNVDKFLAWAKTHENASGYVKIGVWASKDKSKLYGSLNAWEPPQKKEEGNTRTSPSEDWPEGIDMKNHPLNP